MFCVVLLHTFFVSSSKNVTPGYRAATRSFLSGETLYPLTEPVMGFLYLPGFATLYVPFEWMGPWLGDAAWKATGLGLLTYAAWSNCRDIDRELRLRVFSLALVISMPLVAGSFLQGQANIHLAAACWLVTLAAFRGQVIAVVFWTGIAVLAKPLAIVILLLVGAVRPRMIPAMAGGIVWALALPFLAMDAQYVLGLYQECWRILTKMATASRFMASDVSAIFIKVGWQVADGYLTAIRCAAALGALATALWLCARLPRNAAALAVMILGSGYMCLFNPRSEGLTYAVLALPCAIMIALYLYQGRERALWATAAAGVFLAGTSHITGGLLNLTRDWFRPTVFIFLFVLMTIALARTWTGDVQSTRLLDAKPAPP
jgi:hypothetical protein